MNLPRNQALLIGAALFISTVLLFSQAADFDFLNYDDPDYVTQNFHVQGGLTWAGVGWAFTSIEAGNWHPLTWVSHLLDWQVFGDSPGGHHVTNILWHALNAVMAFLALRRLTGAQWTSAAAAALFAWHPLRVESVAWIAERKDVISVFFGLVTLWAYAAYAEQSRAATKDRWRLYAVMLASFVASLLCKPMLVAMPFLLLLLDRWPLRRAGGLLLFLEKLPLFGIATASCLMTYFAQKNGGAVVATLATNDRFGNAVVSVARYLGKLFWPFDLAACYPHPGRWAGVAVVGAILLLGAISCISIWQRRQRPWLLLGWLWFLGLLVPVLGFVQVGLQAMADRYTYLPSLGLYLALCWTLGQAARIAAMRRVLIILVLLALAGCVARTWNQLGCWRSSRSLFEHALAVTEKNYLAHCYLGTTLFNAGNVAEAETHFARAIALKPDYAAAHCGHGAVQEKLGRIDAALESYHKAVQLQPSFVPAQQQLGAILLNRDEALAARAHFEAAVRCCPEFVPAHLGLGLVAEELGQSQEARRHYQHAVAQEPRRVEAHFCLGNALDSAGRPAEALAQWEEALRLQPNFPGLIEVVIKKRREISASRGVRR